MMLLMMMTIMMMMMMMMMTIMMSSDFDEKISTQISRAVQHVQTDHSLGQIGQIRYQSSYLTEIKISSGIRNLS